MNRIGVFMGKPRGRRRRQRGVTLVELMVSLVIALLVIAVALSALLVSRGISGMVDDAAQLQQQAGYALRLIGQQVRQAGSTELNLSTSVAEWNVPDASGVGDAFEPTDRVAFMTTGYTAITNVVSGGTNDATHSDTLTVGFLNYWEPNTAHTTAMTLFRGCFGGGATGDALISSTFSLNDKQELVCQDSPSGDPEPVIKNVADFQVNYLVQQPGQGDGPTVFRARAADVGANWNNVYAVEVCLELFGDERVDLPDGSEYTRCDGSRVSYGGRLHMVFRETFQLRSQGLF